MSKPHSCDNSLDANKEFAKIMFKCLDQLFYFDSKIVLHAPRKHDTRSTLGMGVAVNSFQHLLTFEGEGTHPPLVIDILVDNYPPT